MAQASLWWAGSCPSSRRGISISRGTKEPGGGIIAVAVLPVSIDTGGHGDACRFGPFGLHGGIDHGQIALVIVVVIIGIVIGILWMEETIPLLVIGPAMAGGDAILRSEPTMQLRFRRPRSFADSG